MKLRIDTTLVFETLMIVIVAAMLTAATGYPEGVRIFPFVVGIPTLILLFCLWLGSLFSQRKPWGRKAPPGAARTKKASEESDFTAWIPILNTLGWITGYYLLILFFGFFVATPVWLTAFFLWKAHLSFVRSLLSAAVSSFAFIRAVESFGIILWPGAIPKIISGILGGGIVPPI